MTISQEVGFEVDNCISCGVQFALPVAMLNRLRKGGVTYYCPNGHSMWYGPGEADKLRDELARKKSEAEQLEARLQTAVAVARLNAEECERLKVRAANGVCPCCKRSFKALGRHMNAKHPAYVAAHGTAQPEPRKAKVHS